MHRQEWESDTTDEGKHRESGDSALLSPENSLERCTSLQSNGTCE